jgi:hypothetical protein
MHVHMLILSLSEGRLTSEGPVAVLGTWCVSSTLARPEYTSCTKGALSNWRTACCTHESSHSKAWDRLRGQL